MKDRYDNLITTTSPKARDHYIEAVDLLLAGQAGIVEAFEKAVGADPGFALGYAGMARGCQFGGNMAGAKSAMAKAEEMAKAGDAREQSHINAFALLIAGKSAEAYAAIRAHVDEYPRDALVAQTCSSVFGLIGFSGQPGREAEILAYTAALLPHYGEDWWCLSQYAFALCENGVQDKASSVIDRSLGMNPLNANGENPDPLLTIEHDVMRRKLLPLNTPLAFAAATKELRGPRFREGGGHSIGFLPL